MRQFFKKNVDNLKLFSPVDGSSFAITVVKDEVFSKKMLGDGLAFQMAGKRVSAPCSGKLISVFPDGHAFGILMDNGVEILIHIGLDTINLRGKGFNVKVKQGDDIRIGSVLVELDQEYITHVYSYFPIIFVFTEIKRKSYHIKEFGMVKLGKTVIARLSQ